jgi:hypothetical protein
MPAFGGGPMRVEARVLPAPQIRSGASNGQAARFIAPLAEVHRGR